MRILGVACNDEREEQAQHAATLQPRWFV